MATTFQRRRSEVSQESNKEFVARYLAAISGNPKPSELVSTFVADPALIEHIAVFETAFPCYELTADDILTEGDKVAIRATFRGVHRGDFQGIAPTGREVAIPVWLIYRLAGGKVAEHWMVADSLALLQQLGALPAP